MPNLTLEQFEKLKRNTLFGRYISLEMITPILEELSKKCQVTVVGNSVEGRPIHSIQIGDGQKKVLFWSQMHGNESTTTKAILDLLHDMTMNSKSYSVILETCTLCVIPMLNPDGAEHYTRVNANSIDLNRDAQDLSQPESRVLKAVFEDFKPNYCFNLHGQRTIFGAGTEGQSAVVSFLAPAFNESCDTNDTRLEAMAIIGSIVKDLQVELSGKIGLYDDAFNINCVGDTFQNKGIPTILFEAGHYPEDYDREVTRYYIFRALFKALEVIANGVDLEKANVYKALPLNAKCFYDVIFRNVKVSENTESTDVAFQFEERLAHKQIDFIPKVAQIGNLQNHFGHKEFERKGGLILSEYGDKLSVDNEIVFVTLNSEKILIKS
ncbi:M14 family metallopeptidase [Winogradskyella maritima]|uniref:M14 metallopeptidase family protein n=1 Tax=Winogradskyella maritima TaxID=1517766 RepID=A0ABV8AMP7_9FLAO|nr:M14 family metallopeptidase [Winogradskyella maritima]